MPPSSLAPAQADSDPLSEAAELAAAMADVLAGVLRGKPDVIRLSLVALFSGGHLLIEDVPGIGKTLLAKALARSIEASFRRIQATPDLLPGELTGVSVFAKERAGWEFRPGPLFAHVVLVDEINRATPRTQSALLEAMEEHQVTVDGVTHRLPEPFFLVATQNPFEHAGTFPLVEGQRDRFALVVQIGLPPHDDERDLLLGTGGTQALEEVVPVATVDTLHAALTAVRTAHCHPLVADYIVRLAEATRDHPEVQIGASPRASLAVLHAAQAHAVLSGRDYVAPDDVKAVAGPALAHRLILRGGPDIHAGGAIVAEALSRIPVPRG